MPTNLYAICRPAGETFVKRIRISQPLQEKIEGIFSGQYISFMEGVEEEVVFNGEWKPDDDEILTLESAPDSEMIAKAVESTLTSSSEISAENFDSEGIKGLFVKDVTGRILIQKFTAQQNLARRFSLIFSDNVFRELTAPAFCLDTQLAAVFSDGKFKFRRFYAIKNILALSDFLREATSQQVEEFCALACMAKGSSDAVKDLTDQASRRMIGAIMKSGILALQTPQEIETKATAFGIRIRLDGGKIVLPSEKKELKTLLRFLDDGIYEAALSSNKYMTNSKRPFGGS